MLQRAIRGALSDDDDDDGIDDLLAKKFYAQGKGGGDDNDDDDDDDNENEDEDEDDDDEDGDDVEDAEDKLLDEPEAPASRGKQKRKQAKTYAPPPLEGYASYFEQHRPGGIKTSNNTLANLPPLDLGEYHRLVREYDSELPHAAERMMLMDVHRENFGQWEFELSQGFNVILYGYGSKRQLLMEFASKIWSPTNRIVVVNGYVSTLTTRDILNTIFTAILGEGHNQKPGSNPNEMLDRLIEVLGEDSSAFPRDARVTLILHSIDGESLRHERHQSLLSRLAAHPRVSLITSIDHIKAPHLWDSAKISQFNFLWHDATTFTPYSSLEVSVDELLYMGGSGRVGGTKGVKYVLASLPQNAKELYRILVGHQLQAMEDDCGAGGGGGGGGDVAGEQYGIEYKVFYQMAVEEFICSNDMAFRTLLTEYVFPFLFLFLFSFFFFFFFLSLPHLTIYTG